MSSSTTQAHIRHAHPAFPSLVPSSVKTAPTSSDISTSNIPSTPAKILKLITACQDHQSVYYELIPALSALVGAKGSKEKEREKALAKGEDIMAVWDQDLTSLSEGDVRSMAAGLVFIVSARLHQNHIDQPTYNADLLNLALNLCIMGDVDQMNMCGARLGELAWGILRLAKHLKAPESALYPIRALIERAIRPTSLSGAHAAYLEACLLTRQYDQAQTVIHNPYVDVKTSMPSYLDVITFFHHAGLISAAVQDWEKATEMFSMAVSVPTSSASAIQLACAKRAILCGLLLDGKMISFPKYTAGVVTRVVERNAKEYVKVAEAFIKEDWKTVRGATSVKEFKEDCNVGLLDQVISSIPIRRILKLKEYYSKMLISDIAQSLEMGDTQGEETVEDLIQHMITSGMIQATVEGSIVSFEEDNIDYTSSAALLNLKQLNNVSTWLEIELTRGGRELGMNREYLKKQSQVLENGPGKGKGGKDDTDMFLASGDGMPGAFRGPGIKGGKMKGVGGNMADKGF